MQHIGSSSLTRIKPVPPALEVCSLNNWTAREVFNRFVFLSLILFIGCCCCCFFDTPLGMQYLPQWGTEPMSPAVEAQSLNYWTTREVSTTLFKAYFFPSSSFLWGWSYSTLSLVQWASSQAPILLWSRLCVLNAVWTLKLMSRF